MKVKDINWKKCKRNCYFYSAVIKFVFSWLKVKRKDCYSVMYISCTIYLYTSVLFIFILQYYLSLYFSIIYHYTSVLFIFILQFEYLLECSIFIIISIMIISLPRLSVESVTKYEILAVHAPSLPGNPRMHWARRRK